MSGGVGSGFRVHTETMRHITELQCDKQMAADLTTMQEPDEIDEIDYLDDLDKEQFDLEQEDTRMQKMPSDTFLDKPEQPCPYENLPDDYYKKTTLFNSDLQEQPHPILACDMLHNTFFRSEDKRNLENTVKLLEQKSNFKVKKLESIMNKRLWTEHKRFAESNNIQNTHEHYHGTKDPKNADKIAEQGFTEPINKEVRRSKYGEGYYTSTKPWEALSYCNGNREEFKMMIVSTHIGPHTGGWQDGKDFGKDVNGNPNLTFTSSSGTIFCAKSKSQLLVMGIITLSYIHEKEHTEAHKNFVEFYNPDLARRIQDNKASRISAGVGGVAGAGSTPGGQIKTHHQYLTEGQVVKICNFQEKKFNDFICLIRKIILGINKNEKFYFLQPVFDNNNEPVNTQDVNMYIANMNMGQYRGYEGRDRCCIILQSNNIQLVDGAIADAAIDIAAAAWADTAGVPTVGSDTYTGFAISDTVTNKYSDSIHKYHKVGEEVFIDEKLCDNKNNKKYEKYVGCRGEIKKIKACDGENFWFFVHLTHDQDDNPISASTEDNLLNLNGKGFKFLNGPERDILKFLPCKASYIQTKTNYTIERAKVNRAKRAAEQSGSKKARIGDTADKFCVSASVNASISANKVSLTENDN